MKIYGFYTENYEDAPSIATLMTGDGKTLFTPITYFETGNTAIGFSYGQGKGIGVLIHNTENKPTSAFDIKWQVKFECVATIDSMIATLQRIREQQLEFEISERAE